jgi:hypothetical protein
MKASVKPLDFSTAFVPKVDFCKVREDMKEMPERDQAYLSQGMIK